MTLRLRHWSRTGRAGMTPRSHRAIMAPTEIVEEMSMATTLLSSEDAAQLRTYERERHNALAEGYIGFFAPVTALAIAPLLEAVRLAPGMKLLDVPTGSGALAAEA